MRLVLACSVLVLALVLVACGGSQHEWEGEFTARLEGASASIEKALETTGAGEAKSHDFVAFTDLSRELEFKGELIERLQAPSGCSSVQEKGLDNVRSFGLGMDGIGDPKNFTPVLFTSARYAMTETIAKLERIAREAETCVAR